ncbi:uncharacterized protein LOC132193188 isoform X2 [Neocloeon triangulifer]|uniref:uncharacterized protein LOC132193188 isoform X2 n=1 Tax=Neocloeon triangulifer TaxID=2078957 RepID=UPI00286F89C2|nr:uncharacterized protein LOC132193188 isoform X2 [Neocloeon triangulifer]
MNHQYEAFKTKLGVQCVVEFDAEDDDSISIKTEDCSYENELENALQTSSETIPRKKKSQKQDQGQVSAKPEGVFKVPSSIPPINKTVKSKPPNEDKLPKKKAKLSGEKLALEDGRKKPTASNFTTQANNTNSIQSINTSSKTCSTRSQKQVQGVSSTPAVSNASAPAIETVQVGTKPAEELHKRSKELFVEKSAVEVGRKEPTVVNSTNPPEMINSSAPTKSRKQQFQYDAFKTKLGIQCTMQEEDESISIKTENDDCSFDKELDSLLMLYEATPRTKKPSQKKLSAESNASSSVPKTNETAQVKNKSAKEVDKLSKKSSTEMSAEKDKDGRKESSSASNSTVASSSAILAEKTNSSQSINTKSQKQQVQDGVLSTPAVVSNTLSSVPPDAGKVKSKAAEKLDEVIPGKKTKFSNKISAVENGRGEPTSTIIAPAVSTLPEKTNNLQSINILTTSQKEPDQEVPAESAVVPSTNETAQNKTDPPVQELDKVSEEVCVQKSAAPISSPQPEKSFQSIGVNTEEQEEEDDVVELKSCTTRNTQSKVKRLTNKRTQTPLDPYVRFPYWEYFGPGVDKRTRRVYKNDGEVVQDGQDYCLSAEGKKQPIDEHSDDFE